MRDFEPPPSEGMPLGKLILLLLGILLVFIGLGLGLWLVSIGYQAIYHPDQVPLIGKVLALLEKEDAFFEQVNTDTGVRFEGIGVRYGVLLLLLIVAVMTLGTVVRGFIHGGSAMIQAAMGKPPPKARVEMTYDRSK